MKEKKISHIPSEILEENKEIYNAKGVPPGAREKKLDIIAKSAYNNDRAYEGCTRSVLAALIEHLHLSNHEGAKESIKASTGLAGGVCRMGRHYDFKKDEDGIAWYKDGGLDKCPIVCADAARLAAEIILDLQDGR